MRTSWSNLSLASQLNVWLSTELRIMLESSHKNVFKINCLSDDRVFEINCFSIKWIIDAIITEWFLYENMKQYETWMMNASISCIRHPLIYGTLYCCLEKWLNEIINNYCLMKMNHKIQSHRIFSIETKTFYSAGVCVILETFEESITKW